MNTDHEHNEQQMKQSRWGFRGKTVWDWLPIVGAFLIPVVIALGTGWITWHLATIENQRAEAERELAEQRAQDEALQAYLDQMSTLLLEKDLHFSTADNATEDSKEARTLARARTLTVLGRLDPSRKTAVMQFLAEAELVQRGGGTAELLQGVEVGTVTQVATELRKRVEGAREPIIRLSGANLSDADLSDPALREDADPRGALLSENMLNGTDLSGADLNEADLREANLSSAGLLVANLRHANLSNANLSDADLPAADLSEAYLRGADLSDAWLTVANLYGANLSEADLSGADLSGSDLTNAKLSNADLSEADLSNVDLTDAKLSNAYLRDAKVTNDQLEQAYSLEGATMPDGQTLRSDKEPYWPTFEDWLKSKDQEENKKSDGSS